MAAAERKKKNPNAHRVVVRTEVLEVAKAGVAEADEDGHTQDHQREERRGGPEP